LSLARQKYQKWDVTLIFDAPKDNSIHIAGQAIHDLGIGEHVTLIVRPTRCGLAYNMYHGIQEVEGGPNDILAIVDADDTIKKSAFSRVMKKYSNPDVWVTHGSYIKKSKGRRTRISRPYPKTADVRKHPWRASHLKTMRLHLAKSIPAHSFQHDGKWLEAASDVALMIPAIEMAGMDRVRFVRREIYIWRDNTRWKTNRESQITCEKIIRNKKRMKRITCGP
jgi:glycosyltransferase involved in cell wall biosynthesis